jgi:hypothetical protein
VLGADELGVEVGLGVEPELATALTAALGAAAGGTTLETGRTTCGWVAGRFGVGRIAVRV